MPRFEHAGKFWTIELTGKQYTTQFGKLGSSGQTRLKKFPTANEARAGFLIAVHAKEKEGYVDVSKTSKKKVVAAPIAGNAALEAAIDADPYDKDAYAVYADALQDAGDPRGELIALQLRNKHAAAQKFLAKHEDYFLGPLAVHRKTYDHQYEGKQRTQVRRDAFTWQYGFIHALRLSRNIHSVAAAKPKYDDGTLNDVIEAVLAHPSGRFLAEITVAVNFNDENDSLQEVIDVLAKQVRPTIRKLHFGDYRFAGGHDADLHGHDTEISWFSVGKLGKLWKKVPGLTHLILQGDAGGRALGGGMVLGTIELPNLVHAELRTGGLSKANFRSIAKGQFRSLEHLDVWFGEPNYGGDVTVKDVQPLLDRRGDHSLRHLGLRNAAFTDELIPRLAKAKLVSELSSLDLSLGCLSDDGARALVAQQTAFAHLDKLDVSKNLLDHDGIVMLKKAFGKRLVNRGQRDVDPEMRRYPAIGE